MHDTLEGKEKDHHCNHCCSSYNSSHPSVLFYRDECKASLHVSQNNTSEKCSVNGSDNDAYVQHGLSVIALHQLLLPPSKHVGWDEESAESYAMQIASNDGLELLRCNWSYLLHLLFPRYSNRTIETLSHVDDTIHTNGCNEQSVNVAEEIHENEPCETWSGKEDIKSSMQEITEQTAEVYKLLTVDDVSALREASVMDRLHYSYIIFLRFYGWRMHDDQRGVIDRHRNWRTRYNLLSLFSYYSNKNSDDGINNTKNNDNDDDDAEIIERESQVHEEQEHCLVIDTSSDVTKLHSYSTFNFYNAGLVHITNSLLDLGFYTLVIRLVEFLIEEMNCDRLLFLYDLVNLRLLELVYKSEFIDQSHKRRLRRRFHLLTCSDSDE